MGFVNSSIIAQSTTNSSKRIYNETIALANTEQSLVVLDLNISGYLIKIREGTAELKLSHVSGESGTKYLTIPQCAVHTDEHSYDSLTLYFQSSVASVTVEIVTWT